MLQLWFVANTVLWPIIINIGGLQLGLNVVVLTLVGVAWLGRKKRVTQSAAICVAILVVYLVFSVLVAFAGPCNDKFSKMIITGPILIFLTLIGFEAGRAASDEAWLNLQKTATWTLLVAFSAFLLEMAFPSRFPAKEGYRFEGKYSGLFSEPSHVAFSLFPCIAVLLVSESKSLRRRGLLALVGLLVFSRSSTLIAMIAAWILYRLIVQRKLRQSAALVLGAALIVAIASAINYDSLLGPTAIRIADVAVSSETENISSLVYVQGWQDALANLKRTHGLGLGFDMMGCHPLPDVPARQVLALAALEELNAQDGSFLFGKVVSEAGIVGIVFYIVIIWWWIRIENAIRISEGNAEQRAASTQAALIFCFVASSFIRGPGYFSGGLLLWIAAVSGIAQWQKKSVPRKAWVFQPRAMQKKQTT